MDPSHIRHSLTVIIFSLIAEAVGGIEVGMLADSIPAQQGSPADAARERIQPGPLPDWVVPCSFASDFKPEMPGQITYLLCDEQFHAEKRQQYTHIALRLETIQAVQRESEWRIVIDPRRQQITVHWIKVHRGEQQFDQTRLNNLRPITSGTDGRQTLALLLEDVRPGDILEWSYTVEDRPLLMAGARACFFALPEGAPLGKLFISVRFDGSRPMKWKSSAQDLAPAEAKGKSEVHWVWARENLAGPVREDNTPEWHITHPWIQVSDCPDWATVAADYAVAWNEGKEDAAIKAISQELRSGQTGILEQAEKALDLVQEEYRHLAEDADLDGEPPVAPEIVARRRFGNSKDLSFLLVQLLRGLGISARLVLVNTKLRKSLRDLLPAPGLFNHVVVEFEARGERRWLDATAKGQGGALLNRVIPDYGVGLPVAQASSGLVSAPIPLVPSSAYEIKESILLDTSGAPSLLGVVVMARGSHAEDFHREFESLGVEGVSRQRLQLCIERFGGGTRVGPMEYRDDRKANEFFLAEIFEIKDFLKPDVKSGRFKLEMTDHVLSGLLKVPESTGRRAPFALPYPCDTTHTFEVYCVALAPGVAPERTIDNPWLQFTSTRKMLAGNWIFQSTLRTLTDAVPPGGTEPFQNSAQEIRDQSTWSLMVPAGVERPHQRGDFGTLPAGWDGTGAPKRTPLPAPRDLKQEQIVNTADQENPSENPEDIQYKRRRRHRRRRHSKRMALVWGACLAGALLLMLILVIIALVKGAERALPPAKDPPPEETPAAQ
jgi:transglutaminase-like putative cysteine protease